VIRAGEKQRLTVSSLLLAAVGGLGVAIFAGAAWGWIAQATKTAIKRGAAGYLLKTSTAAELVDGVTRIHAGDAVFTPSLAGLVLSEFRKTVEVEPGEPGLTPCGNEILRLVAKGYAYEDIAKELFISTKTVQNLVRNIVTKLHLRGRYELMRYAIKRGLDAGDQLAAASSARSAFERPTFERRSAASSFRRWTQAISIRSKRSISARSRSATRISLGARTRARSFIWWTNTRGWHRTRASSAPMSAATRSAWIAASYSAS
jgi:DNA-binding CsgD family transcriptional regulator